MGACAGVALATVSDVTFELRGALAAAASACASATLKVLQQDVLQRRGWSSLELMRRTWGPQLVLLLVCMPLLDAHLDRLAAYELSALVGTIAHALAFDDREFDCGGPTGRRSRALQPAAFYHPTSVDLVNGDDPGGGAQSGGHYADGASPANPF